MKVLTIKQPWATLIIDGYKKYEFRSWKTNYRGKILIHAGNLHHEYGAIIGEADLIDCIKVDNEFQEKLEQENKLVYGNHGHVANYAWKLENIKKYDKPIYINGKLGLWNYDK